MSGAPDDEVTAMVADIGEMDRIIGQFLDFGRGDAAWNPPRPSISPPWRAGSPNRTGCAAWIFAWRSRRACSYRRAPCRSGALASPIDNALRYAAGTRAAG